MGMRVMAGRAILLFRLSEMLSKPQAGLTPVRLKENRLWVAGHSCSTLGWTLGSPLLFPVQGEAAEQDKPCPCVLSYSGTQQGCSQRQPSQAASARMLLQQLPAGPRQSCVCRCLRRRHQSGIPCKRHT